MDDVLKTTDWVTCPYDPNHRMKYSKFHNHFVKCKEAHPDDPREQCPYYASELVHPKDMKEHLITCKYKALYADLYFDASNLPRYDAPCNINFDEESGNESDSDVKTVITIRDDKSSLLSGSSHRSYKPASTVSQPIGKFRRNNYIDPKPRKESYAFKYIEEDDLSNSLHEVQLNEDSGSCSWDDSSNSYSPQSNRSPSRTFSGADSSRSSNYYDTSSPNQSTPDSPIKPFDRKENVGFGRGRVLQRLLSSSTSSLDSSVGGFGRGAWLRSRLNSNQNY